MVVVVTEVITLQLQEAWTVSKPPEEGAVAAVPTTLVAKVALASS
jgi:hypothetical protein